MPVSVTCPACNASFAAPTVPPGDKFACACGQRIRLPPASANRTVLVRPDDEPEAAPVDRGVRPENRLHCGRCRRDVRPVFSKRMSNPWAWLCVAFGLLTCLVPVAFLGTFLVQRIEKCPDCDEVLRVGPTTFGT